MMMILRSDHVPGAVIINLNRRKFLSSMAASTAGMFALAWQDTLGRLAPYTRATAAPTQAPGLGLATGRIEGMTVEMGSGHTLADVVISTSAIETASDPDGIYSLDLAPGSYDLRVQVPGYIAMSVTGLQVRAGESTHQDLELIAEYPAPSVAEKIDARILALAGSGIERAQSTPTLASVASVPTTLRVVINYASYGDPGWVPDVVTMSLDEYLRGVVPSEMPSFWSPEALKAQAVAARSYATAASYHPDEGADICTTTHCQVWNNVHYDPTDQAIGATHNVVALYANAIISAFYFGHCTGHTVNPEDKYPGWYVPYCRSVPCAPCAAHHYTEPFGHEVGLCQEGANGYANPPYNWNYSQILHHYYTGISLTSPIILMAPPSGQLVRGLVLATVEVDAAPQSIDFYLDDQLAVQMSAAPWQAKLSTAGLSDGAHIIKAKALSAYNPSEATVNILVDNTPPSGTASVASGWHNSTRVPFTLSANGSDAVSVQFSNNWIWEGEDLPHTANSGVQVDDASAINGHAWHGSVGTPGDWYGPYYLLLPAAPAYQAYYRLKTSARTPAVELALLDVVDEYGNRTLAQRTLYSDDLSAANIYEEVPLAFAYNAGTPAGQGGIEFRTRFRGNRDLTLDHITVFSNPRPLAATVNWLVTRHDGQQSVMVRFLDAAGNTFDRTVTVWLDVTAPALEQQDANAALAQDTVSGLDLASAAWSDSADGGVTWSNWQPLAGVAGTQGTTAPVTLNAPTGAATDVRFRIADMAGNAAITRGSSLYMPNVFNQTGS
jgi:hypothetical protein